MSSVEIILVAIGLAMDAAAVSMVAAAAGFARDARARFRLAFHFGLFQALMPILGWVLGRTVVDYISHVDHWVAFGLLLFIGTRMVWSGLNPGEEKFQFDPTRGWNLITLSVATSIDALAVGLSIAMLEVNLWYSVGVIGLVTAFISLLAIQLGRQVSLKYGHWMEILGGVILVGIGLRILISHLMA